SRPARTFAKVLLPDPFGPMTACTSPACTSRSSPRRISAPLTLACRSSITSIADPLLAADGSANAALETHAEELLGFHGELHRQFAKDLLAETVDDHRHGILGRDAPLPTIEELVLADLVVAQQDAARVLPGDRRAGLDLRP